MFNRRIFAGLIFSLLLSQPWVLASEATPAQPSVVTHLSDDATFNQTHTFVRAMILNQKVVYEQPLVTKSSADFKHWHDVDYRVTSYSADKCKIVYGRLLSRPEVHGHAAFRSKKGVSFDMKQVDRITLQAWSDFDPQIGRSSSQPSRMIMFYGPVTVISDGKGSTRTSHGMTVDASNAERILKAFQHVKTLCAS